MRHEIKTTVSAGAITYPNVSSKIPNSWGSIEKQIFKAACQIEGARPEQVLRVSSVDGTLT